MTLNIMKEMTKTRIHFVLFVVRYLSCLLRHLRCSHHPPSFSLRVVWTCLNFRLYPFLLPGILVGSLWPLHIASCGVIARHGVGHHICHLGPYVLRSKCLVNLSSFPGRQIRQPGQWPSGFNTNAQGTL